MSNDQLSDEERALLEENSPALENFRKHIETEWETLACRLGCDVATAQKVFALYDHKRTVGPIR